VFINVLGNVLLYMPFELYLLYQKQGIMVSNGICLIIIILFEMMQYIFKRGVFDIVDILINYVGVLIITGIFLISEGVSKWIMKKKMKEKKLYK